jgi:hypothetical protein
MEDTPGEVLHCQFYALVELHKKRRISGDVVEEASHLYLSIDSAR